MTPICSSACVPRMNRHRDTRREPAGSQVVVAIGKRGDWKSEERSRHRTQDDQSDSSQGYSETAGHCDRDTCVLTVAVATQRLRDRGSSVTACLRDCGYGSHNADILRTIYFVTAGLRNCVTAVTAVSRALHENDGQCVGPQTCRTVCHQVH